MTLPRIHLFDPDTLPAMRRLWDEGLCGPAWTTGTDTQKRQTCRVCPVRSLCEDTGRAGRETGEVWGGWSGSDGNTAAHCHNGHLLLGDNLLILPSGERRCLTCRTAVRRRAAQRQAARRRAMKEAAA